MRRPLTGALLGILLGLAIAVVFQQAGVWPLDRLTVFLMPALLGFLGLLLLSLGRKGDSIATLVIALIILVPMTVWGALGLGSLNATGELNGGCEVAAQSAVDSTNVTDTSKQDPFEIDPTGSLKWAAMSPFPFMDYDWSLYTEIGGIQVPLDSGHEMNDGGSTINAGDVANVQEYAESKGINISQLRGVFIVGGEAADTCDGFGFVLLTTSNPFATLISQIALAMIVLILVILIILAFRGRGGTKVDSTTVDGGSDEAGEPGAAADIAAGAIVSGHATPEATEGPPPELSDDDVDEIQTALDETMPDESSQDDGETHLGRHEGGGET